RRADGSVHCTGPARCARSRRRSAPTKPPAETSARADRPATRAVQEPALRKLVGHSSESRTGGAVEMGLFARFTCLRRDATAMDFARTVRDLLRSRNVVETPDPAAEERLLMIAPAGDGWLMVVDHVEDPSAAMADAGGLLAELSHTSGTLALDIFIADSDEL